MFSKLMVTIQMKKVNKKPPGTGESAGSQRKTATGTEGPVNHANHIVETRKFHRKQISRCAPGSKNDLLDVTGLIRSIQRAEGNPDCFGKANDYCDRLDCAWREYCLKKGP